MSENIQSYCGLCCDTCDFRETNNCGGCIATNGHPFHGKCEVAECAKEKGRHFCGECGEIPCEILSRYSYDPVHGDNGARIENCNKIKSELVAKARVDINPISVCGHHCDYCFMGQWCGGCRSDYNCCSFATVMPDKVCPNVKCAGEKGLESCSQCCELKSCEKGYYGNKNEYVCKATALFINKYGEEKYSLTLKRAIDAGENYPKSFDAQGSVDKALTLLEKYL